MPRQLTADDARQSLTAHAASKGSELWAKYGPDIGWKQLSDILNDRMFTRYPCEIVFGAGPLNEGEFAYPVPKGERPEDGFALYVHPHFATQLDRVPYLALYQLVLVNYGEFASPDDAESFGAAALNISREEYYEAVCKMADEVGGGGNEKPQCGCGSACG
jgi:hypothetical protein